MTTYTEEHKATAELIYYELKETPLTIGELSQTLNLPIETVSHVIKDMPDKYPICQQDDKYYVPKWCPLAWVFTFFIMCVVLEIFVRCGK